MIQYICPRCRTEYRVERRESIESQPCGKCGCEITSASIDQQIAIQDQIRHLQSQLGEVVAPSPAVESPGRIPPAPKMRRSAPRVLAYREEPDEDDGGDSPSSSHLATRYRKDQYGAKKGKPWMIPATVAACLVVGTVLFSIVRTGRIDVEVPPDNRQLRFLKPARTYIEQPGQSPQSNPSPQAAKVAREPIPLGASRFIVVSKPSPSYEILVEIDGANFGKWSPDRKLEVKAGSHIVGLRMQVTKTGGIHNLGRWTFDLKPGATGAIDVTDRIPPEGPNGFEFPDPFDLKG